MMILMMMMGVHVIGSRCVCVCVIFGLSSTTDDVHDGIHHRLVTSPSCFGLFLFLSRSRLCVVEISKWDLIITISWDLGPWEGFFVFS